MFHQCVDRLRIAIAAFLMATAAAGCASTGAVPRPFPLPAGAQETQGSHASGDPQNAEGLPEAQGDRASEGAPLPPAARDPLLETPALVGTALALRGSPYRNGGADPNGFDCSGFTRYVFAQNGVEIPRSVREQYQAGQSVAAVNLSPGDLLFFSTTAPGASHVGIAVGGGLFVHAPSSTGVVRVERLSSSYWAPRFLGARRVAG